MDSRINQDEIKTLALEDMAEPELTLVGKSIMGTREYQQDTYYICIGKTGCLAVICDGMGGLEHGEEASRIAVERIAGDFENWSGEDATYAFLKKEALLMDQAVVKLADQNGNSGEMGTTTVSVIVQGDRVHWLSVGDSRIYISRDNEMACVTRDHNFGLRLQELVKNGEISEDELEEKVKQQEALISFLGMDGPELIDVNRNPFILQRGDRILLCSDGLYKCLPYETIKEIVQRVGDGTEDTVNRLLTAVEESPKRGKDNTTVILLEYR